MSTIDRRRFLSGMAAGGILFAGQHPVFGAGTAHTMPPAVATPDFKPDIELELNAVIDEAGMLSGESTRVWRYTGRVMRGGSNALSYLDGSRHIPVIRVRRGQKIRVFFHNRLPEETIVHWHGLNIAQRVDGHPMYAIGTGRTYVYEFTVDNRAGTYWLHPHPHERTAFQVYHGLVGLFLISDAEEDAAKLPAGELDLPIVIQDRTFDARNQLVYIGPARRERMMGFSGERVLVNGAPDYARTVPRTAHRIRLFNGSNATAYRLRWSNGRPFTVIGTDGGLLERPLTREHLTLAVAERADVWVDFSAHQPGEDVSLLAESYSPMLVDFTASQQGAPLVQGARPIARFRIGSGSAIKTALPQRLSSFPPLRVEEAVNRNAPRRIQLAMAQGQATLNGRTFGRMDEVADDEKVKLNTTEIWEFANDASFGMQMAHPMHIHHVQFRVLGRSRNGSPGAIAQRLGTGFTDEGLKDTVLVLPGERVRVLMKFENHTGIYMYHCHILEHEDIGMMRNFLVQQ